MNALSLLITSGFKNWKTTVAGMATALLYTWQSGGFDGMQGRDLVMAAGAALIGYLARDANKSSQDSGVRPFSTELSEMMDGLKILAAMLLPLICVSCATRADGTATFAGLDEGQWQAVGLEAGKGALVRAVPEYARQREALGGDKVARSVQP